MLYSIQLPHSSVDLFPVLPVSLICAVDQSWQGPQRTFQRGARLPRAPRGSSASPGLSFASFFFNKIIYLFIFWLHWVFVAARGLSSCGEQGLFLVVVHGLTAVASLVAEHGL